ncbi:iron-sulfur cluster assembly accessory protein [Kamptonema cortianum]|nr:iron-sulfur cluster assembly accessory protein [Geitlerinema splendidum]MDK3162487.1 iron-sulfur cluster assembly accessory protein [Kamptonema cortianum]
MSESEFPVTITPEAWVQIKRLLARKGEPGQALRIGVKGGGCTGLEYVIRLDEKPLDIDLEIEQDGVRVVCDAKSSEYLAGSTLVYTGNLIGGGFKFENPNADRSCGCGTSFSVKRPTTS